MQLCFHTNVYPCGSPWTHSSRSILYSLDQWQRTCDPKMGQVINDPCRMSPVLYTTPLFGFHVGLTSAHEFSKLTNQDINFFIFEI